ncbi:MAG TPA: sigma-70 family RNA polymerase sigma factor [Puia sp.]|nr:sigma-70 family RNA polymerase sigma factor [Puia sp.]
MEINCSHYFLSETALAIWQQNDLLGEKQMFECLYKVNKETFFRRVIFRHSTIKDDILGELAENAFLSAWEAFNENGKAGKIKFASREHTGYFFIVFKNHYLKLLEKENRQEKAKKEILKEQFLAEEEIKHDAFSFSHKVQKALNKISPDCKDLLRWKHIEGLSHDEIAAKRNINRSSSIKMLSRCGKRFLEIYNGLN